jgi:prevent-host-death family protein
MNIIPTMVSVSDLQRDSARIIQLAKTGGSPVIVMKNNKPEAALLGIDALERMSEALQRFEMKDALSVVREGEEEYANGETILLSSHFRELVHD